MLASGSYPARSSGTNHARFQLRFDLAAICLPFFDPEISKSTAAWYEILDRENVSNLLCVLRCGRKVL